MIREMGKKTQAIRFPSQLTWSRDMLKSAATEKNGHNLRKYQEAYNKHTIIGYRAKPCPWHTSDNIEKDLQMPANLWEVGNNLRSLYSPKPQDQRIDVCIIDTGQLACQSQSILQPSGSPTLHGRCIMNACPSHSPLLAEVFCNGGLEGRRSKVLTI